MMTKILTSPYFLLFCVPIISIALSLFLKIVSRNDNFTAIYKEDFAFGLDLAVTALIIFLTESVRISHESLIIEPSAEMNDKIISIPWFLVAFLLGIWGVSTLIRKIGWENSTELNRWSGIIIPDFFGIFALILVLNWVV